MVEICPAYLEKDLTFTFLLGRVKTILIRGFKIFGPWVQNEAKGSEF